MSISRAQRARLGIFLVVGTVLLIAFAGLSLGMRFAQSNATYFAYFQGESMSGLEQSATVKYTGVPIGKVEKISYDKNDLSRIRVTMKIQSDFPMKAGMYAISGMLGITGLKYVEILGGDAGAKPLQPGSEIPTRGSIFNALSGKAEVVVAKIELLLNNLNALTNPDSLRSMRMMLDNVAAITNDARIIVHSATSKIDSVMILANDLFFKVDHIATDVRNFTGTLDTAISAGQIARTIARVDSSANSLKQLSDNLALIVRQSREDFSVSMENIREATESANQLAKLLAENPSLLLKNEAQKERGTR